MTQVQPTTHDSVKSESAGLHQPLLAQTPINHILQKLSRTELLAQEHFERYLRHKWRLNHKPMTLQSSFTSVMLFVDFCGRQDPERQIRTKNRRQRRDRPPSSSLRKDSFFHSFRVIDILSQKTLFFLII